MQQLTGLDALFLNVETTEFPMHIGGVSIYDQRSAEGGTVRFKDILATFESRLDRSPIFRRKLRNVPMSLDNPYWVDDEHFDLEYHVRHIALPKPGDWRQLCIQVARLHAQPLDRARPLWQVYVIEGLDQIDNVPKGSFALYLKVHHAAMDGASGMQFFAAINDREPLPRPSSTAAAWNPQTAPGNLALLGKAYLNNLKKPWQFAKLGAQVMPARKRLKQGQAQQQFEQLGEKQATRFNRHVSPHRVVEARKFDFDELRAIKNHVAGATINDVVLTIVAGAMRKYLHAKGELPEKSLVSGCPIDVRDGKDQSGGNIIGMMNVNLHTDIDDPLARLIAVHASALSAKAYANAIGTRIGLDVADAVPGGIVAPVVRMSIAAGLAGKNIMLHTVVTNVPGAAFQLYLCGAELVDSFGVGVLAPGLGLFHTVTSAVTANKGTLTIAAISCREILPDPEFYAACLQDSFDELAAATHSPTISKARKAKARRAGT